MRHHLQYLPCCGNIIPCEKRRRGSGARTSQYRHVYRMAIAFSCELGECIGETEFACYMYVHPLPIAPRNLFPLNYCLRLINSAPSDQAHMDQTSPTQHTIPASHASSTPSGGGPMVHSPTTIIDHIIFSPNETQASSSTEPNLTAARFPVQEQQQYQSRSTFPLHQNQPALFPRPHTQTQTHTQPQPQPQPQPQEHGDELTSMMPPHAPDFNFNTSNWSFLDELANMSDDFFALDAVFREALDQ